MRAVLLQCPRDRPLEPRGNAQLIKSLYGEEQLELARPSLNSVLERRDYANMHWHDIRKSLRRLEKHTAKTPLLVLALSSDDKISGKYRIDSLKVQANATALIQSLHAIPDIYAHEGTSKSVPSPDPTSLPCPRPKGWC